MKIATVSPVGLIPDTRTASNSGVGLTEVAMQPSPSGSLTDMTPNATLVGVGVGMIAAYPGGLRSMNMPSNWLNDKRFRIK